MMWNPLPSATDAEHLHATLNDSVAEITAEEALQWDHYEPSPPAKQAR